MTATTTVTMNGRLKRKNCGSSSRNKNNGPSHKQKPQVTYWELTFVKDNNGGICDWVVLLINTGFICEPIEFSVDSKFRSVGKNCAWFPLLLIYGKKPTSFGLPAVVDTGTVGDCFVVFNISCKEQKINKVRNHTSNFRITEQSFLNTAFLYCSFSNFHLTSLQHSFSFFVNLLFNLINKWKKKKTRKKKQKNICH